MSLSTCFTVFDPTLRIPLSSSSILGVKILSSWHTAIGILCLGSSLSLALVPPLFVELSQRLTTILCYNYLLQNGPIRNPLEHRHPTIEPGFHALLKPTNLPLLSVHLM